MVEPGTPGKAHRRRKAVHNDSGEGARHQPDQDQRVPRGHQYQRDQLVHRAVQLRRQHRRPVELDCDRAPGPAAHLLDGDRPAGTTLASHHFYLLGLANSGLATPASAGDSTVNLTNATGLATGDQVQIGTGPAAETRTITQITDNSATGPRVPGEIGNALKLSGNGEYVNLPSGIVSGLHDFTISA